MHIIVSEAIWRTKDTGWRSQQFRNMATQNNDPMMVVEELRKRIANLEATNDALQARNSALEEEVATFHTSERRETVSRIKLNKSKRAMELSKLSFEPSNRYQVLQVEDCQMDILKPASPAKKTFHL